MQWLKGVTLKVYSVAFEFAPVGREPKSPGLDVADYEVDQHLVELALLVGDGGSAP